MSNDKLTNGEKEKLAMNVSRFFTLILLSAGVFAGMGAYLLLGNKDYAIVLMAILAAACIVCGLWFFREKKGGEANVARFISMVVFIAGIFFGMGCALLLGSSGAILVLILLFMVILIMGIWMFRPKDV